MAKWLHANKRNKSMRAIILGQQVNEKQPYILLEWLFAKERINEKRPYMLVEGSCTNKRNKSMRTIIVGQMVVHKRKNK